MINKNKAVKFSEINIGDSFYFESKNINDLRNGAYMKAKCFNKIIAVNLEFGDCIRIKDDVLVEPLEAKIIIKNIIDKF